MRAHTRNVMVMDSIRKRNGNELDINLIKFLDFEFKARCQTSMLDGVLLSIQCTYQLAHISKSESFTLTIAALDGSIPEIR